MCGYSGELMPEASYDVQRYLGASVKYPEEAKKEGIEGRVLVRFVVTEKGLFDSIRVVKPVYPSLDSEAVRVVTSMPPWKPGKKDGRPVRVSFTMPVIFRLE